MKKYENIEIEIIFIQTDVIRTSGPGDKYEGDVNWGI